MSFQLHPQLEADTHPVLEMPVSSLRLMNDRRFPWLILIPRVPEMKDLHELPQEARAVFQDELQRVSEALVATINPFKLNVAALGNLVPQLHVHIIARDEQDAAWPGPVWGVGESEPYAERQADELIQRLRVQL